MIYAQIEPHDHGERLRCALRAGPPEAGSGPADHYRSADLVAALMCRFAGDARAALACFDDYAGAFDRLADFGHSVRDARRDGHAAPMPVPSDHALVSKLIADGEAFALSLGQDLHIFWTV